jgi:hypothetical protein
VGGARESIHVESFKALTVIESKLDATRKKLARRLLEEQDKLSKAHFAQKGGEEGEGKGCLVTLVAHADYSGPCGQGPGSHGRRRRGRGRGRRER